jgi:hypothetical protein
MLFLYNSQPADRILCKTGFEQTTNDFRLTWCRDGSEALSRKVVPKTYKGKLKVNKSYQLNCSLIVTASFSRSDVMAGGQESFGDGCRN